MKKVTFVLSGILISLMTMAQDFQSVNTENFIRETWNPQTVILDVRSEKEYEEVHIAGAVLIDVNQNDFIKSVQQLIPADKRLAVYCRTGNRSKKAANLLAKEGYTVTELDGGIMQWLADKKPVLHGSLNEIRDYRAASYKVNKNFSIPYRYTTTQGKGEPVLVVYCHSSHSQGFDNEAQVRSKTFQLLVGILNDMQINAQVLAPQKRVDRRWNEYRPMENFLFQDALYKLITDYAKENNITKIYLVGSVSGGAAVWKQLTDHPTTYTAAMLTDSYPLKNDKPKKIAKTPLYIYLSEGNTKINQQAIADFVKQINDNKGKAEMMILPVKPYQINEAAITPENIKNLLEK